MARRHELSDAKQALIEPHLPPSSRGRAWADHRRVINRVLFWASTGLQWRDLPERYGPWQTVYERSRRWRDDGTWQGLLGQLQQQADRAGLVDWSLFCMDSTTVRAGRSAAGGRTGPPGEPADYALGRSRGGFSTKLHLVTDGDGRPLAELLTAGQAHESRVLEAAVGA